MAQLISTQFQSLVWLQHFSRHARAYLTPIFVMSLCQILLPDEPHQIIFSHSVMEFFLLTSCGFLFFLLLLACSLCIFFLFFNFGFVGDFFPHNDGIFTKEEVQSDTAIAAKQITSRKWKFIASFPILSRPNLSYVLDQGLELIILHKLVNF